MNVFTTGRNTRRTLGSGRLPLYIRGRHRSLYLDRFALNDDDRVAIVHELEFRGQSFRGQSEEAA